MNTPALCIATAALVFSGHLGAVPFQVIRIGDLDGFGYGDGSGPSPQGAVPYTRGFGNPVNNGPGGPLEAGDELPSLNGNSRVLWGDGDDFDNRSGEGVATVGATNTGSTGVQFTDISLSRSYDTSSNNNSVWTHGVGYGAGGAFPMPPSNTLPNQPGFVFDFFVATGDITPTTDLFFNLVFGDYDVSPAVVRLTSADASTKDISISTQPSDGLIQEASVTLDFDDVFTPAIGGYDGYLAVDFLAPNEPYTAFDYVEISFLDDPGGVPVVPDGGSTLVLIALSLGGLLPVGRRMARATRR